MINRFTDKIIILTLFLILTISCSKKENEERKALSHCADIKFINYANNNPYAFLDRNKVNQVFKAIRDRDKEITKWTEENHNPKDMMAIGKLRGKMNDLSDPINLDLFMKLTSLLSDVTDITSLNQKTLDWKVDYKKEEFQGYAKFHLDCWNEYKKDNGYYTKEFIGKYSEWQKQDLTRLGQVTHREFDKIFKYSENFIFTSKFTDHFSKLLRLVPRK